MTQTIAIAGKGGVGKTTICGMLVDYLVSQRKTPVLVVDADANSNLNEVLGVEAGTTLGEIREDMAQAEKRGDVIPGGMTKAEYAEFRFSEALAEEDDFDMLVMGRTQGKGCYCFVNGILQAQLEKYTGQYRYTVIDNEAGMEYIARGTLPHVDTLLLVSDCSRRGIQAVGRIAQLAQDPGVLEEIEANGLELAGVVPQDEAVYDADCAGQPSAHIAADAKSKQALREIFKSLNI